jgi:UDP-glucose 4-epimerase
MTAARTLLVTGAARRLGTAVLRDLAARDGATRILAVDLVDPPSDLRVEGVEHVHVDLRAPAIATLIAKARPDTVLHLDVLAAPGLAGGRTAMKERNVIGTMQLLAACQRAPSVRRLVVRSSDAVYGCAPRDPAHFSEDTQPHRPPRAGFGKDCVEVEEYVRGFARRRPDVSVTVLRFAGLLGPGVTGPVPDYLALPVLPTVAGFDPRLQFVHIDDAVRALRLAANGSHPGVYNVAGAGSLTLSQLARRLGRPTVPVPHFAASWLGRGLSRLGVAELGAEQVELLTFGRVLDLARMTEKLRFRPARTSAEAVADHARSAEISPLIDPDRVRSAERGLIELLDRYAAHARKAGDGRG